MRSRLLLSCVLLALAGCSQKSVDANLATEVRTRLAERDTKLTSYRIAGTVKDEGQEPMSFTFDYRAPQRMRGSLGPPASRTFAWDGTHLFQQVDGEKSFSTFKSELPPAKLAGFLNQTFSPFTPEGFRTPLLLRSATARRAAHPRAPEAVELVQTLEGEALGVEMVYVLRWPRLDFLGKRTRAPDGTVAEERVEDEHCDKALELCVPKRITRWLGGKQVGETVLGRVELNATLPNDAFTLTAPEGYAVQSRTLVESGPAAPPTGG
jgi:outer membrane lipoprotein-sorting protein